ncbi:factor of DNA methylation 2-like [Fagus crenata]
MSNRNYEEELNQVRRLAVSLSNEIDYKNQRLLEMENKYNETTATVCRLVVGLTTEIDSKTRSLLEMEQKYSESSAHVKLMVNEIDKLHAEIRQIKSMNGKLVGALECEKKVLKQQTKELEESKAQRDLEQRSFGNEIEKFKGILQAQITVERENNLYAQINTSTEELDEKTDVMQDLESLNCVLTVKECMTNQELQESCKELMEINTLTKEIDKKTNAMQDLESPNCVLTVKEQMTNQELHEAHKESMEANIKIQLQLVQLKGKLQAQDTLECDNNLYAQIDTLRKELDEKTEAMQDLESLNCVLTVKERMTNQELQEARKESMEVPPSKHDNKSRCLIALSPVCSSMQSLQDMLNSRSQLAIRRMGEIDWKPFQHMCSQKFPGLDCKKISAELCSKWQEKLRNPQWQPFKIVLKNGEPQEQIDEEDENLQELRNEWGEDVYKAVTKALLEINEVNASGRYLVPEIWNLKEKRRASMKEIIQYLIKQLKTHKRKRKRC